MTNNKEKLKFPGFPDWRKNYWKYPVSLNGYRKLLSGTEEKVLNYILRQCCGWDKDWDKISLSQFQQKTGLSRGSVLKGVEGLVEKGFIWKKKINYKINEYGLVVQILNESGSNLKQGGSNLEPVSGSKVEHTIDNNNRYSTKEEKEIEKTFSFYKEKVCPDSRLTKKGKKLVAERLKEVLLCGIEKAIINFSKNNWWMENHRGNGIEWFFKSEGQIDKFMNLQPSPENRKEALRRP